MVAYGLYGLFAAAGYMVFWYVTYLKFVKVYMEVSSMSLGTYILIIGGGFTLAVALGWLLSLTPLEQLGRHRILWVCFFVAPSLLYYLYLRRGTREVKRRAEEIRNRIAGYRMILEREPNNWAAYLGLAGIYDEQNSLEEAIEAYSTALSLMGDNPLQPKTEGQVEVLKRIIENRGAKCTLACRQCGARNLPTQRYCTACQASLYRSIFHWVFANIDSKAKYALAGTTALFSLFLFWISPLFVLVLILLWVFDIIYFSLPAEFNT